MDAETTPDNRAAYLVHTSHEAALLIDCQARRCVAANATASMLLGWNMGDAACDSARTSPLLEHHEDLIDRWPQAANGEVTLAGRDGIALEVSATRQALQIDGRWHLLVTLRRALPADAQLALFRAALDQAADQILVIDPMTLEYLHINKAAEVMLGMTREAMMRDGVGKVTEARAGVTAERTREIYSELIEAYPAARTAIRQLTRPDGTTLDVETTRHAVRLDERWLIVSVTRDVTERTREQRHLKRLLTAINEAPDCITVADPVRMENLEANEATVQMYGLPREELVGVPLYTIAWGFGVNSAEDLAATYRRIIDQRPEPLRRVREFHGKGRPVAMVESTRRAVQVDGEWLIVGVMRDVTERVNAERELQKRMEELARSNRDLEQFAYVTSHDLSEPLRMVAS